MRSVMPPCPGMLWPKSLMSKARLKPEAKNPPKGATSDAKQARKKTWYWYGANGIVVTLRLNCDAKEHHCVSELIYKGGREGV